MLKEQLRSCKREVEGDKLLMAKVSGPNALKHLQNALYRGHFRWWAACVVASASRGYCSGLGLGLASDLASGLAVA